LTLKQFKVIIDLGINGKPTCDFLLVIVTLTVSATVFEVIFPPHPCFRSPLGGTSSACIKAPSDEIYDKSTQGTCGLQLCRYLHSFSCCYLPNLRNPAKFYEYSNFSSSRSSKVIVLGVNRKRMCNFLLVTNCNHERISYRFRDIYAFSSKRLVFPPHPCLTPPSGGTPCTINVIYTRLKSTFIWLQYRC